MKKLIIFNWKLNPEEYSEAEKIAKQAVELSLKSKKAEFVVCPPFVYLANLSLLLNRNSLQLGAQDVFWEEKGAYTGEISPLMLKNLKIEYVVIGHSERRKYLDETDEMINKKVRAALNAGLKTVLCVGENSETRGKGIEAVKDFVKNQLEEDLKGIENLKFEIEDLVVAYEPIWAIGTGIPCKPEEAAEIIKFIKDILDSKFRIQDYRVLYGGSVDGKNIKSFIKYKEIDGALVGGASLNPRQFENAVE